MHNISFIIDQPCISFRFASSSDLSLHWSCILSCELSLEHLWKSSFSSHPYPWFLRSCSWLSNRSPNWRPPSNLQSRLKWYSPHPHLTLEFPPSFTSKGILHWSPSVPSQSSFRSESCKSLMAYLWKPPISPSFLSSQNHTSSTSLALPTLLLKLLTSAHIFCSTNNELNMVHQLSSCANGLRKNLWSTVKVIAMIFGLDGSLKRASH